MNTKTELEQKKTSRSGNRVSNHQMVKVIWNHTENAQQMIFYEHWYYSEASYKADHELTDYQPCEEGGRTWYKQWSLRRMLQNRW